MAATSNQVAVVFKSVEGTDERTLITVIKSITLQGACESAEATMHRLNNERTLPERTAGIYYSVASKRTARDYGLIR
jgi:hypothetical protein